MKRIFAIPVFILMFAGPSRAQWIPVSGRMVTTTQAIAADGTVNSNWTTTSQYSRSSSGSILVQHIGRSGKPATGTLLDYGKSHRAYTLTYRTGQVAYLAQPINQQFASHPPTGMTEAQRKVSLGNDKVNGVDCFMVPVYGVGVNRSRVLIGKACLAPAYNNLIVREDVVRNSPTGGKLHVVREFKITSPSEPDSTLFSTDRKTVASHWKIAASK